MTCDRLRASFVLVVFSFSFSADPSQAQDQIDQEFFGTQVVAASSIRPSIDRAQTFTVGIAGNLLRVELAIAKAANTPDQAVLTIEIRPTDMSGAPLEDDQSALATASLLGSEVSTTLGIGNTRIFDFGAQAPVVDVGDELAIVARTDSELFTWAGDAAGNYAGGSAYTRSFTWSAQPTVDNAFRTFVPEPAAGGLATAAIATLWALTCARTGMPRRAPRRH